MHPYYLKNKQKFKKSMNSYLKLISKELEQETGQKYPQLLEEIWTCYEKDFLSEFMFPSGKSNRKRCSIGTPNCTSIDFANFLLCNFSSSEEIEQQPLCDAPPPVKIQM